MRPLKTEFKKNGVQYTLIERNEKVALFSLDFGVSGYEVSVICQQQEKELFGNKIEAAEIIASNEQFGADGSKAFSSSGFNRAQQYYKDISRHLLGDVSLG